MTRTRTSPRSCRRRPRCAARPIRSARCLDADRCRFSRRRGRSQRLVLRGDRAGLHYPGAALPGCGGPGAECEACPLEDVPGHHVSGLPSVPGEWRASNPENPADPYMTMLGYFSSLRELGGTRQLIEDELTSRLTQYGKRQRLDDTDSLFVDAKLVARSRSSPRDTARTRSPPPRTLCIVRFTRTEGSTWPWRRT